jgi:hypothetical protein
MKRMPKGMKSMPLEVKIAKIAGSPDEVEKAFGLNTGTLANLRHQCKGPRYRKVGNKVLYVFSDVQEWLNQFVVQTSESIGGL